MFSKNGRTFAIAVDGSPQARLAVSLTASELLLPKDFVRVVCVTDCHKTYLPEAQRPAALLADLTATFKEAVGYSRFDLQFVERKSEDTPVACSITELLDANPPTLLLMGCLGRKTPP